MNLSGNAVKKAWGAWWRSDNNNVGDGHTDVNSYTGEMGGFAIPRLAILHDELERPLGSVVQRNGSMSARGHNGLRSIMQAFQGGGKGLKMKSGGLKGKGGDSNMSGTSSRQQSISNSRIVRIGIGIGRPNSRNGLDVSRYVLRQIGRGERMAVEGAAEEVLRVLMEIEGE